MKVNKMSKIPSSIVPYIELGKLKRKSFINRVDEFFDDFDAHVYIRGQAGIGKTHAVTEAAKARDIVVCSISGKISAWLLVKKIAVACHLAGWPGVDEDPELWAQENPDARVIVYVDDCKTLFKDEMIDVLKIALENRSSDRIVYGASLGAQLKQAAPHEQAAIAHFIREDESGFEIPFHNRVKFIFTMNRELCNLQDVTRARKADKSMTAIGNLEDRYAIFSRLDYEDLYLDKNEYWGWIADLVLNENILESATVDQCEEILMFCYYNWDKLADMSVRSVVNKLWLPLSKFAKDPEYNYLDKWQKLVVS